MLDDVTTNGLICPTKETLEIKREENEKYLSLILGLIKSNYNKIDKMVFYEHHFPSVDIFGFVMCGLGEYFSNDENIEVVYAKPEDKKKDVHVNFTIKNKAVIAESEKTTFELKELKNKMKKYENQ